MSDVTEMLNAIGAGNTVAQDQLLSRVYGELRVMAATKMAQERPGQTLQATALVHEAWMRLVGDAPQAWQNRAHFFGAAAEAMRRILVDRARKKSRLRHGGQLERVNLEQVNLATDDNDDTVLAVHEALEKLAKQSREKSEIVKLRYFTGLEMTEIAEALSISVASVHRDYAYARAWLHRELKRSFPIR